MPFACRNSCSHYHKILPKLDNPGFYLKTRDATYYYARVTEAIA